jgi:hypothetical protein
MENRLLTGKEIILLAKFKEIHNLERYFKHLTASEIIEIIYHLKLALDVEPYIGKTDSICLLQISVERNDIDLVKRCVDTTQLIQEYNYDHDVFRQALDIGNVDILTLLIPRAFEQHVNYEKLVKLPLEFVAKYYNLYPNTTLLDKVCQFGSNDVFEYFYPNLKFNSDSFSNAVKSGHLNRVKQLEHLYGQRLSFDEKYNITRTLDNFETWYISDACSSGNLELVQYLLSKRQTPEPEWEKTQYGYADKQYSCPYIHCAAKSGNVELVKCLFDLGYKIGNGNRNLVEYSTFSGPMLELFLQNGLDPLACTYEDDGTRDYSFQHCIDAKNMSHLLLLKQYSNQEQWDKIMRQVLSNFDSVFIPLITDTRCFKYATNEQAITHMWNHYGPTITHQQWIDLYVNLIHERKGELVQNHAWHINIDMFFKILERVWVNDYTKSILEQLVLNRFWSLRNDCEKEYKYDSDDSYEDSRDGYSSDSSSDDKDSSDDD